MFRLARTVRPVKRVLTATRAPRIHSVRWLALPPSKEEDTPHIQHNPYTREFPSTINEVARMVRLFLKYSFMGFVSLGSATLLLFQGAHIYVEKVSLASEDYKSSSETADISAYEWDQEAENWTGRPGVGGTDPDMTWRARQAVRSAWMSLHWGRSAATIGPEGQLVSFPNDNRLAPALSYLGQALQTSPKPSTRTALLELQAGAAEALNTVESLAFAKASYQAALEEIEADTPRAAKILSRISSVLSRLGLLDQAIETCWKSVQIVSPQASPPNDVPDRLPTSPLGLRILLQDLIFLSAYYASSRDLDSTLALQSASLALVSRVPKFTDSARSPARLLHDLYVEQRVATLNLHQAEVIYAITGQPNGPQALLSQAASSSESIAFQLTGETEQSWYQHASPPAPAPSITFISEKCLSHPATNLLRDASRSAATAYHLSGILYEKQGAKEYRKAFDCLEKALWWCGGTDGPAPNVPTSEWQAVWADYTRLRGLAFQAKT